MKHSKMIAIYLIIGLAIIAIAILVSYKGKSPKEKPETELTDKDSRNQYEKLRNMGLSVTPSQLGLMLRDESITVYGVVMDWDMGGPIATIVAYVTGDASLYLSSGGGVIGGGQHENVSIAAKFFIEKANSYINSDASKTTETPLPTNETVAFYLLTNKGIYNLNEKIINFKDNTSDLTPLFEEGNKVLYELRQVSE